MIIILNRYFSNKNVITFHKDKTKMRKSICNKSICNKKNCVEVIFPLGKSICGKLRFPHSGLRPPRTLCPPSQRHLSPDYGVNYYLFKNIFNTYLFIFFIIIFLFKQLQNKNITDNLSIHFLQMKYLKKLRTKYNSKKLCIYIYLFYYRIQ